MATEIIAAETAVNLEKVVVGGDLSALSPAERMGYYRAVCESVGLNPLTRPFEYLKLNGKLVLYARKDATDQMRSIHGISIELVSRVEVGDCYVVTAKATNSYGRTDESTGVVAVGGLKGEALANALMKAETKAKRRVTLSICGMGFLDETEIDTIPASVAQIDHNRRVQDVRESLGVPKEAVLGMLATFGAARPNDLTPDECDQLVAMIEAEAAATR
jgi:hypothetical protein